MPEIGFGSFPPVLNLKPLKHTPQCYPQQHDSVGQNLGIMDLDTLPDGNPSPNTSTFLTLAGEIVKSTYI